MRILTWNVNGIRSARVSLKELLDSLQADILCFQETKVTRDQLDETVAVVSGYNAYFSFSRKKSGYSGVVTYCKNFSTPTGAEEGLTGHLLAKGEEPSIGCYGNTTEFKKEELESLDGEGRAVITQHETRFFNGCIKPLTVINVYIPRSADSEERHEYKLQFLSLLQIRAETLLEKGSHVVIVGDINTVHKALDHCNTSSVEFNSFPSRIWLNQMFCLKDRDEGLDKEFKKLGKIPAITSQVKGGMFVDAYRQFHPNKAEMYTNWSTVTGARLTNYGKRLDYIMADKDLAETFLVDCVIMSEIEGSDHCPVKAEFDCNVVTSIKCPQLCSKFMPEFAGTQQKLSAFFSKFHDKAAVRGVGKEKLPGDIASKIKISGQEQTDLICFNKTDLKSMSKLEKSRLAETCCTSVITGGKKKRMSSSGSMNPKKKKMSDSKQVSLINFFGRKIPTENDDSCRKNSNDKRKVENVQTADEIFSSQELVNNSASDNTFMSDQSADTLAHGAKMQASAWKSLLKGPDPPPLCKGHNEPCVLRLVKKKGPNKGRQFYTCARPEGADSNTEARCSFFKWIVKRTKSQD